MEPEKLVDLVNLSGFPFQLRIQEDVARAEHEVLWSIVASEHYWADGLSGESGFIDLILRQGISRLVIECKRVRGGTWVFLIPKDDPQGGTKRRVSILDVIRRHRHDDIIGWKDMELSPATLESSFCVLRGQDEKDRPMLERLSGSVLKSMESLAGEEIYLKTKEEAKNGKEETKDAEETFYFGAIVTNADLVVCEFAANAISLDSGELSLADSRFRKVPFVRFRKTMPTKLDHLGDTPRSIEEANRTAERTLLIVQAVHLLDFLRQCPG